MFNNFSIFIRFSLLVVMAVLSNLTYAIPKADVEHTEINDGPYIFVKESTLEAYWLCKGEVITQKTEPFTEPSTMSACGLSAKVHELKSIEENVLEFSGNFSVAALSDFHGQYDLMIKLLTNNKIIDENKQWIFGNGHFVITGDIFDRGDKVTEILWFLYDLERQAEQLGGKIHLTLGNHEVMILNGDLRYLHPKYVEVAKLLDKPFEGLFSKHSILGDWLRSKPVLVKVNNMLFAHGGFHPSLAKDKHSLESINHVFKKNLVKAELASPRKGWAEYLHKRNGPIWYRGYFKDNGASSEEIDLLLKHFEVSHIVVGHTSQKQIETRHQGRVIAIDSSIKNGQYGEILLIEPTKEKESSELIMWRGNLMGEKLPLKVR
ncbi:metallophosphoesterase [Litorilituus lipolyticus]|uniref:Metallophosphoesterase n=1 Tax=Litorilituus lipolyticus TaxID=2491017 RepID=A0A502LF06_9GAMM|nr:metallophosphoesterase [Litorilituus lipolyticus]TPH18557.1 metallophosphoesterase [Litorilituus lipolyticus]